ncbi:glycosyltransferase [Ilumatobacter nonamiensis]|uniref:glycosyltransferase n=1 Tax=Ilumatobacter nonamiensis TaxID=467093 RepID=UPI0003456D5D|nr:glycosyltransferase [Ilumatobacter nonamiensis]
MAAREVRLFVAPTGNAFMRDIASWIVEAAGMTGRHAELVEDRLPHSDGSINLVVAPHEFYLLGGFDAVEIRSAARCSIPICTEQPGTQWFTRSLGYCVGSPLVVDINAVGVAAIEREGFHARRLQLGAVPGMDHWSRSVSSAERSTDVVFLGALTEYRAEALAALAPVLWDRSSDIRAFPVRRPIVGGEPGLVFGTEKYDLLADVRVLINVHRDDASSAERYFEWARMVEAMANGCVVVTEPSTGCEPLVAGEHFLEADVADMADVVSGLLDDEDRRNRIAEAAYAEVMGPLGLQSSVGDLLQTVEAEGMGLNPSAETRRDRRVARRFTANSDPAPLFPVYAPYREARREVYDAFLAELEHRREIGRLRARVEFGDEQHVTVEQSAGWTDLPAEVSVVVTMFDYAHTIVATLDSIAASSDVTTEIVVVDDASRDDGLEVVRQWMDNHPSVGVKLVRSAANRGLPGARNLGIDHVRTEIVMMMDADNLVYPTCLRRLADALTADPEAAFAYSTLEAFGDTPGLRSAFGWHVPWLCDAPYIDAQAMFRTSALRAHGGYRVDTAAYGWEDWDLWLGLAAAGECGVHVAEMLGRYRTHSSSMVSLTNLAADGLRAALVERYPHLPWPELT